MLFIVEDPDKMYSKVPKTMIGTKKRKPSGSSGSGSVSEPTDNTQEDSLTSGNFPDMRFNIYLTCYINITDTVNPRYSDSICSQRCCH